MIATAEPDDPDMAALIALAAVTGARRGELCGLVWTDVDFDQATLRIERSVAVVAGQRITKDTKTHAARVLALDPFGLEVIRRQRARLEDRAADLGIALTDDICPGTGACPVVIDNMIVWRDPHHLTATFSRSLGPALDAKVVAFLMG